MHEKSFISLTCLQSFWPSRLHIYTLSHRGLQKIWNLSSRMCSFSLQRCWSDCADWSLPLLFTYNSQDFSGHGTYGPHRKITCLLGFYPGLREYEVGVFWYQVYQARLQECLLIESRGLPSHSICIFLKLSLVNLISKDVTSWFTLQTSDYDEFCR